MATVGMFYPLKKLTIPIVQKCKKCNGGNEKKSDEGSEKKLVGKIPSEYLKRLFPDGRI